MNNFTPRAQQVLALARKEAGRLRHQAVDPEHMLLGILLLDRGVVVSVLKRVGFDYESMRQEIEKRMPAGEVANNEKEIPYTLRFKKVLMFADAEAKGMGHSYTGTEHMLLGLLREGEGIAAEIFQARNIELEQLRSETLKETDPGAGMRTSEVMNPVYVRELLQEFKCAREDISKKFDQIVAAVDSLKADFSQLRFDLLKGNQKV